MYARRPRVFRAEAAFSTLSAMDPLRADILGLLDRAYIAHLATTDGGGPWSAPVHIYHDGLDLYWRSEPGVRHSVAIERDARMAISIVIAHDADAELALQMAGTAARVDIDPALARRFRGDEEPAKEEGRAPRPWFRFTPEFIELIDTARFGYTKRRLDLYTDGR